MFAIIGAWLTYQIQNKDVDANDTSEIMFQKAIIVTALGFILSNIGPIDDWYVSTLFLQSTLNNHGRHLTSKGRIDFLRVRATSSLLIYRLFIWKMIKFYKLFTLYRRIWHQYKWATCSHVCHSGSDIRTRIPSCLGGSCSFVQCISKHVLKWKVKLTSHFSTGFEIHYKKRTGASYNRRGSGWT